MEIYRIIGKVEKGYIKEKLVIHFTDQTTVLSVARILTVVQTGTIIVLLVLF